MEHNSDNTDIYRNLHIEDFLSHSKELSLGNFTDFLHKVRVDLMNFYSDMKRIEKIGIDRFGRYGELSTAMKLFLGSFAFIFDRFYRNLLLEEKHVGDIGQKIQFLGKEVTIYLKKGGGSLESLTFFFDQINIMMWGLEKIVKEISLIETIKHNIETQNISISGQGIFDKHQDLWETEILTRMINYNGDIISPYNFLKVVHDTTPKSPEMQQVYSLVSKLDRTVIEKAFKYISNLEKEKEEVFSININPITLKEKDLLIKIVSLVEEYSINPTNIVFEILEYSSIDEPVKINNIFCELRKIGFKIAVDDYPEGYNTLNQIAKLENVDIVKLDGDFVIKTFDKCFECHEMKSCLSLLNQTIDLNDVCVVRAEEEYDLETFIRSLKFIKILYPDIRIFAEKVENENVYNFLEATGLVDGFQGYYEILGKPRILYATPKLKTRSEEICDVLEQDIEHIFPENAGEVSSLLNHIAYEISIEDIIGPEFTDAMLDSFRHLLRLLQLDELNIYIIGENIITIKSIHKSSCEGSIDKIEFRQNQNRIPKEFANLYKLLYDKHNLKIGSHRISEGGIAEEGDDITVQVTDKIIIGFDEEAYAKNIFSEQQRYLIFSLIKIIRNLDNG